MNKIYLSLLIILLSVNSKAQSWTLSNILFGAGDITEIQSANSSDGSIITLGHFTETIESTSGISLSTYGGRDYFISKMNASGEIEWIKQLGGPLNDFIIGGITISNDDAIYATGSFNNYLKYTPSDSLLGAGFYDVFVCKLDLDGNIDWCRNIGSGSGNQRSTAIKVDNSDDLLISGFFSDSIYFDENFTLYDENSSADIFYAKLNPSTGDPIWTKQIKTITGSGNILNISANETHEFFICVFNDSIQIENDTLTSDTKTQDIIFFKTDLAGNVEFSRKIKGDAFDYSYAITQDTNDNIYLAGYYNSTYLTFESSNNESTTINENNGDYDLFICKYDSEGAIKWVKTTGSSGLDKIYDIEYFDNKIHVSGLFEGQLPWGGITLSSSGLTDQDMFYGSLDLNGAYRSASSYKGRNNSSEEARAIFNDNEDLITVIRSNSDLLVLGDSIYTNPFENYFIAIGTIGCLPININPIKTDVNGCYGDENGTIFIGASGGFGGPYRYSIDNGDTYQDNDPNFSSLGAGVYPTVIIDNSNCAQAGPEIIINEPDTLMITNVACEDALCFGGEGSITIEASGGTGNVFFSTDGGSNYSYAVGTAENFPEGTYSISISDANDCITDLDSSLAIEQPDELTITLESSADITDEADGEIVVSAAGGTNPYSFTINPSAGTQNPDTIFTFSAGEGGDYIVEVDDANNCGPVSTSTITISDLTNISNPDILNASIYPNPSSGMVTVEFNTDKAEMTMEVFSIDGRNVMSRQVYSKGGHVKETLDLSSLDKGMYMIRVDQQTLSSAVVIN